MAASPKWIKTDLFMHRLCLSQRQLTSRSGPEPGDLIKPHSWSNLDHIAYRLFLNKGPVAQWIEHRPPEPGVARSNRARVIKFIAGR